MVRVTNESMAIDDFVARLLRKENKTRMGLAAGDDEV